MKKTRRKKAKSSATVLDHSDPHKMFRKRRKSTDGQKSEPLSQEDLSNEEKQSMRAWVERWMKPPGKGKLVQDFSVDGSSSGSIHNLRVCVGPSCNGDTHAATLDNGTSDLCPSTKSFEGGHESLGIGEKRSSSGQNRLAYHHTQSCSEKSFNVQSSCKVPTHAVAENSEEMHLFECVNSCYQEREQLSSVAHTDEVSAACHTSTTHACHGSLHDASGHGKSECRCLAIANISSQGDLSGEHARSGKDYSSCQALSVEISHSNDLLKANDGGSSSNFAIPLIHKRKREDDKVLQYVLKRKIVIHPSLSKPLLKRSRTAKSVVDAWGRSIPVTLTSEAHTVDEWVSAQNGNLFGLDVEWRPNRARGENNKVALLQLCNDSECLIIQMLFLNQKPEALHKLLSDPSKNLAGVGVLGDGKRLLHDYGLECQGSIELTTLAVERLKRGELKNVGLKVLTHEVLGLIMHKPKKVTLSNWAKVDLDPAQIRYACMDAWASFAVSQKLLAEV